MNISKLILLISYFFISTISGEIVESDDTTLPSVDTTLPSGDTTTGSTYKKMEYASFCSGSWVRITSENVCKDAASALNLTWGNSWDGPGDFPGCLHTKDSRDMVYFNTSPNPSNNSNINEDYAEICQTESAAVECECMDPNDPHINHCDNPQGFQKCQVFTNQTCPDKFCDDLGRCFSVLACPNVPIPDPMSCEDCECIDKQAPKCLNDPLGQCNKCQRRHPLSICRVPVDSKCVDKWCFEDDRCYAVTACDCERTPTASPTTDELPMNETTTAPSTACPETDTDFYVNKQVSINKIDDWQACAKFCSHESGCLFWTWTAQGNVCFFKKGDVERRPKEGYISGAVSCQGTTTTESTFDETTAEDSDTTSF